MDVAFKTNASTGKLTFARSSGGNFYLDDRAVYPVLATLFADKGAYLWDATLGTYLNKIRKDDRATSSRLVGAGQDAIEQCRQAAYIRAGSVKAERRRPGFWLLAITWTTTRGESIRENTRL